MPFITVTRRIILSWYSAAASFSHECHKPHYFASPCHSVLMEAWRPGLILLKFSPQFSSFQYNLNQCQQAILLLLTLKSLIDVRRWIVYLQRYKLCEKNHTVLSHE